MTVISGTPDGRRSILHSSHLLRSTAPLLGEKGRGGGAGKATELGETGAL